MSSRVPLFRASLALAVIGLLGLASAAVAAPKKPAKGKESEATADKDKPYQEWKKVTKDAEVLSGFFTLYRKRENLYLELPASQLDTPVLGIFSLARGIGSHFLLGGLPLNDRVLEFQRNGDYVIVLEKNTRFVAPKGSPFEAARDLSHGHSVLAKLKIESVHDSSKALLVDFAPFLVSDLTDLGDGMRQAMNNKPARFDKDRSAITSAKVFPENVEIEALLTYAPGDRQGLDLSSVPDDRYIPLTVHYSFSKLPDQPMMPRLADERVGNFLTVVKDFSHDNHESFWVRYANRWRLEKKDPNATLSEPVKPITFYIDHTVPVEYRPYIKKGVEAWRKAFEAAGFRDAIVAVDAPSDPNWDPEDVRYSTIRWIVSHEPAFGAIGPSRRDPRTGEILDADILIEGAFVQNWRNAYRRYVGPDALAEMVQPTLGNWPSYLPQDLRCDAQMGLADAGGLLRTALLVDGALPPGSPVPMEFLGEMLTWVTMHEVGHTLGLRHNFRSSTATPVDKLHDVSWTRQHGLTASVMDYLTPNIAADRSKQGDYFGTVVGDYDVWAIRYAHTPTGAADPQADYAIMKKVAAESALPGHEYSTDDDTYPAHALDPRTNIWDLSADPLSFARERSAYIAGLWKSGKLEDRIIGAEGEYPVLRRAMDNLLGQYGQALGLSVKYVGGQHQFRTRRGQNGGGDPLVPIPAATQREALALISQRAFATDAFKVSPALLNRLGPDRWSHWGIPGPFAPQARVDYNLNDKVFAIQNALLGGLMNPSLMARVREAESRSPEAFKLSELFDRLTSSLWSEVGGGVAGLRALEGPSTRRELQRAYVDRLAALVVAPAPATPDDARALARLQLTRIDARARQTLAGEAPLGDYTRAHLLESRARIKRALEAGRDIETAGTGGPGGANALVK
ncbi:MAG TPA: zinc-dependent metalloprotease [Candidatus Limnocylindria bacterium]|nr:zinc-dependent metalloprotease [Candidatus Limnocylindria bacterium]